VSSIHNALIILRFFSLLVIILTTAPGFEVASIASDVAIDLQQVCCTGASNENVNITVQKLKWIRIQREELLFEATS
jgi:hypothetical protein